MTNRSNRPRGLRRGFTMVELAVAMVLAAFLMFLAAAMINLAAVGAAGGDVRTTLAREDAAFAAKLNDTIQKSTVAFTVPEQSFTVEKLDQGWNYLGLMDNVKIPAFVSLTGEEIPSAQALVYIEYLGTTKPAGATPSDCNLLQNKDGYFYQKVLGHAFTDTAGLTHTYSLTFEPTNSINAASQSIIYNLTSTITNASGQVVGAGDVSGLEIDTMLNNLNAIQVVYRGSASNPAVALAFRPFMPVSDSSHIVSSQPKGTVVLVMDYSSSMHNMLGNKSRFNALRDAVMDLYADLAVNDQVTVIPIPFAQLAYDAKGVNIPAQKWYTPANELSQLNWLIMGDANSLPFWYPEGSETNMGDGLRAARVVTQQYKSTLPDGDLGELFLIVVSDGTNSTRTISWQTDDPYYGDTLFVQYSDGTGKNNTEWYPTFGTNNPRQPREYMKENAKRFANQFNPTTFLLDVSGGELRAEDKQAMTEAFGNLSIIDVDNLTQFEEAFEEITLGIESVLWAFEGPEL